MDQAWIGQKLTGASGALAERYAAISQQTGDAGVLVALLAPRLLREVGRSLVVGDVDPRLPFMRTKGLLRISAELDESMIARAFNGLAAVVSHYICALPGATGTMDRFARDSVRHAARVTLQFRRELVRGERRQATEAFFGGVALLAYQRRAKVSSAPGPVRARSPRVARAQSAQA